ncbi:MAG: GIY-YIG nuclease family protein [Candidatus Latescibacteria bacterium]|nr:GIY-YIG nuclease family protein [Candidatus Latescibacterota bacterium]
MSHKLSNLSIIAIDCQATGANPDKNNLLEVGWAEVYGSNGANRPPLEVNSYLVKLPDNVKISRQVERITGITSELIKSGYQTDTIRKKLCRSAQNIIQANGMELCPAIIHFARFEEPYLKKLIEENVPDTIFPFEIICTHEITKRLLPELPRRGIRAIAGYFGLSVHELRRAGHHVSATVFIWCKLVTLLEKECGIKTLDALRNWLAETIASSRTGRAYPMESKIRLGLPDTSGIYRMFRSNGDILYIGKAKSLKRRVNSYFQNKTQHSEHILEMLTQAVNIEVTETNSALEAALLESDEIKRNTPPYNVSLRKRNRKIWFGTKVMNQFSQRPDEEHTIGPLLSKETLESLPVIVHLLKYQVCPDEIDIKNLCSTALNIPGEYVPDIDCFFDGFTMFQDKYTDFFINNATIRHLMRLGSVLWHERFEADIADLETDSADDACEDDPDRVDEDVMDSSVTSEFVWTPEAVVSSLERVILHGSFMIRRARWFCMLSESTLVWDTRNPQNTERHMVMFENGAVIMSDYLKNGAEIPLPPGCQKRLSERQESFDIPTYDRMRVLTTELRRLIGENREISLCMSKNSILDKNRLEKLLRWV